MLRHGVKGVLANYEPEELPLCTIYRMLTLMPCFGSLSCPPAGCDPARSRGAQQQQQQHELYRCHMPRLYLCPEQLLTALHHC